LISMLIALIDIDNKFNIHSNASNEKHRYIEVTSNYLNYRCLI